MTKLLPSGISRASATGQLPGIMKGVSLLRRAKSAYGSYFEGFVPPLTAGGFGSRLLSHAKLVTAERLKERGLT